MLLMAIASTFAFSHKEYAKEDIKLYGQLTDALIDNWNAFQHDFRLIKPKKFGLFFYYIIS